MPGVKFEVTPVMPATMRECDKPIIAKVSWNAVQAGVATVSIFFCFGRKREGVALC